MSLNPKHRITLTRSQFPPPSTPDVIVPNLYSYVSYSESSRHELDNPRQIPIILAPRGIVKLESLKNKKVRSES